MRGSDDLFRLIKSLDKNEKRYFKLVTGKYETGRDSNYLKLFDAMDALEEYDEEKLKKKIRDRNLIKNLSSEKNHLQRLILRALRNYSSQPGVEEKLRDLLSEARFVYSKAQYELCRKLLARARELAAEHEKHLFLLEIYELEGAILLNTEVLRDLDRHLEEDFREAKDAMVKASNLFEYRLNYLKSFVLQKKLGDDLRNREMVAGLKAVRDLPMYADEGNALSFEAKYYLLFIHFVYYRTLRDLKNTFIYSHKILELFEKNPVLAAERKYQHITAISNYSLALIDLGLYDECMEALERMNPFRSLSPFYRIKIDSTYLPRSLACMLHSGKFEMIHGQISGLRGFLKSHKGQLSKSKEMTLLWNITLCYFGQGQYREALHWLNRMMNDESLKEGRPEMHNYARILNLLIHYELGNYDLIEHLMRSAGRFLNRRHVMYRIEKRALEFFGEVIDRASEAEKKQVIARFRDDVLKLKSDHSDEYTFDAVDFENWAESKLSGRPYPQVIREYAEKERENAIKLLGKIPEPPWLVR